MQTTSIIIPNRNGLGYLRECVLSIKQHTDAETPYEIIVVDNGSDDGSLQYCRQEHIKFISLPSNRGFPAACNLGMRIASGDALMLLNNDVLVTRNWLKNLLRCLYSGNEVGIVGPVTNFASGKQMVEIPYKTSEQAAGFSNTADPGKWLNVPRLIGFCFLFKRELLHRIGLLDEQFSPGHFEDDDYCYRARSQGYRLLIAADTFIYHHGSASFGKEGDDRVKQLIRRNYDKFVAKWGVDPHSFI
ncbi:glycosyltransferase family 2 protein [Paenibacillus thalictri]|uniref:Glycosyltransferase family 2 protein n=1 Tax=Paenibacillus thalictri TaxID=2527873 RepID=A0A4Q9E289_9BACL|nr:glycosyltransferase family 2 protein [Paenibacillus thalictri]TBL81741.1 glycosyltransferase family 2 protein [Paenibacillus thalictri]